MTEALDVVAMPPAGPGGTRCSPPFRWDNTSQVFGGQGNSPMVTTWNMNMKMLYIASQSV